MRPREVLTFSDLTVSQKLDVPVTGNMSEMFDPLIAELERGKMRLTVNEAAADTITQIHAQFGLAPDDHCYARNSGVVVIDRKRGGEPELLGTVQLNAVNGEQWHTRVTWGTVYPEAVASRYNQACADQYEFEQLMKRWNIDGEEVWVLESVEDTDRIERFAQSSGDEKSHEIAMAAFTSLSESLSEITAAASNPTLNPIAE